jgi:hypothetical protein
MRSQLKPLKMGLDQPEQWTVGLTEHLYSSAEARSQCSLLRAQPQRCDASHLEA